jgi:glucose dehydrogenase
LPDNQTVSTAALGNVTVSLIKKALFLVPITAFAMLAGCGGETSVRGPGEWVTWGGDPQNTRYSPLDQIDAENVDQLEVAWRWEAQPVLDRPDSNWKATPLYVNGMLYAPTGGTKVAAIDPATGQTVWMFEPDPLRVGTRPFTGSSRAVSYWADRDKKRILHNTVDGRLISLDADTGELDPEFGVGGIVDLNQNLLEPDDPREMVDVGSSGPGIIVGDVIVVQVITADNPGNKTQVPGYVRGYDVRTGERLWVFHTIPLEGEVGNETWEDEAWRYTGNASVWSMMSADPERGLVYLPVESPTNNLWGGQRPGDGLFGESIVCLDAKTGERVWHYQILHHGVWDYDLPAAPILHDVVIDGETIPALSLLTKQGMNFVFNRVTGEPIWPIEEREVPTEMAVPGERLSPTQPFVTKPEPYLNLGHYEEDIIDFSPEIRAQAMEIVDGLVTGPMYTPPTLVGEGIETNGTLLYPNYGGGSNWNGGAVDPETNTLYVPIRSSHMTVGLRPANPELTDWQYVQGTGGGLLTLDNGLPITAPPWSEIVATDMNEGEHIWRRSIGGAPDWIRELPELQGLNLDFDSMGELSARPSPLVTKTLLFLSESGNIGGDPGGPMFRAYDKATGEIVAEIELPGLTSGAPMTYMHEGRQYIAIAVSSADHPAELVVLALPNGEDAGAADRAASSQEVTATQVVEATPEQLSQGMAIFGEKCVECHGEDGRGDTANSAPPLENLPPFPDVVLMVENGGPEMPAMAAQLTAEQIDSVSRYVAIRFDGGQGA